MSRIAITDSWRSEFELPTNKDVGAVSVAEERQSKPCTYLCGNSLGLLPKRSRELVNEEFDVWGKRGVEGHWSHPYERNWKDIADSVHPNLAELVGADTSEVACMGTLTANLHLMMLSFYKPTKTRYKILCEAHAFPSDQYAFASQAKLHGFVPEEAVREVYPRPGEYTLREEDILDILAKEGPSIALVLFSGIQYFTGQLFPIQSITTAAHNHGAVVGWDLAHAVGNVPLSLHDWDVDFAVWCSYKYLNSGPGGIAGLFLHERCATTQPPVLAGWWGHDPATRFQMSPTFKPIVGAQGYQQSNPSVLTTMSLLGSLQVFKAAGGMPVLRERSKILTAHLERLLKSSPYFIKVEEAKGGFTSPRFTIITPSDPESRGAQLSLLFLPQGTGVMQKVFAHMQSHGVVCDDRQPDVIRLAPAPLYNEIADCAAAVEALNSALAALSLPQYQI